MAKGLSESGEVSWIEVAALRLIRGREQLDAEVVDPGAGYPVVLFSPGNGTSVEFYAAIAEELASQGYVVVGINHPYDVAAVELNDGRVARFVEGPFPLDQRERCVIEHISQRVADLHFALDELERLNGRGTGPLVGPMDLERVAAMGYSLGGIAAMQAATLDPRFDACLNLDGLQRGGPFSASSDPDLPQQPFMFLTKEESLHPRVVSMMESVPTEGYLVTLHGAKHDSFTDGPLLMPSLLPLPNEADRILDLTRRYTLAFFQQTLTGQDSLLLVESDSSQVCVRVLTPPS